MIWSWPLPACRSNFAEVAGTIYMSGQAGGLRYEKSATNPLSNNTDQNIYMYIFALGSALIYLLRWFYPERFTRGSLLRVGTPSSILYGNNWQWIVLLPKHPSIKWVHFIIFGLRLLYTLSTYTLTCLPHYRRFYGYSSGDAACAFSSISLLSLSATNK